jgi:dihydroorotase
LHHQGVFDLPTIVAKAAHHPAMLFGIVERGFIREGYFADLVVVDCDAHTLVTADQVRYKCGWSPVEGVAFNARVERTLVNGVTVYRDGRTVAPPSGRALEFRNRA